MNVISFSTELLDKMSIIKTRKLINCLEYVIYIALLIGALAYLWDVFALFQAKETSMKVKETPITEQPTIVITTHENKKQFGKHIDELKNITLTFSSYFGWGVDPYNSKRSVDSMANHKVIKFETAFTGLV